MAQCAFSNFTAEAAGRATPPHQDEWIYVIDGEFQFEVGDKRFRVGTGESVFIPRKGSSRWACVSGNRARLLMCTNPAGKVEEFFRG